LFTLPHWGSLTFLGKTGTHEIAALRCIPRTSTRNRGTKDGYTETSMKPIPKQKKPIIQKKKFLHLGISQTMRKFVTVVGIWITR
jgi:hypothetical protein